MYNQTKLKFVESFFIFVFRNILRIPILTNFGKIKPSARDLFEKHNKNKKLGFQFLLIAYHNVP